MFARRQELSAIIEEKIKQDENDEFKKSYLKTLIEEREFILEAIKRKRSEKDVIHNTGIEEDNQIIEVDEFGIEIIVLDVKEEESIVGIKKSHRNILLTPNVLLHLRILRHFAFLRVIHIYNSQLN